jgi:serine/threonine-protein kinase
MQDLTRQQLGDFRVERPIAETEHSGVFLARDITADRPVYLIVAEPLAEKDSDLVARFQRRIETIAHFRHPGIAPVIETGTTPSQQQYAVVDYFPGISLADRMRELEREGRRMSAVEALALVGNVAGTLAVAHPAGIIHHHLTPEHILLNEEGLPVLVDLAIPADARLSAENPSTVLGGRLGYESPEQRQGKALSGQSNIYSLGIMLYELIAGQRPEVPSSQWDIFEHTRTEQSRAIPLEMVVEGLSTATYRLVRECLWREEWNRYETVASMKRAVDLALESEEVRKEQEAGRPRLRRRYIVAALIVALLLLAVAMVVLRDQITWLG